MITFCSSEQLFNGLILLGYDFFPININPVYYIIYLDKSNNLYIDIKKNSFHVFLKTKPTYDSIKHEFIITNRSLEFIHNVIRHNIKILS